MIILKSQFYLLYLISIIPFSLIITFTFKKYIKIANLLFFLNSLIPIALLVILLIDKDHFIIKEFYSGANILPNLFINFKNSNFGNLFNLTVSTLYPITTLYSIAYFSYSKTKNIRKFHSIVSISVVITILLAFANNLFTAFIFYDLLSITTYFLVTMTKTRQAKDAGLTYAKELILPSIILLLPAIIFIYDTTGTTQFSINGILNIIPLSKVMINILYATCIIGIAKTALLPLNKWLIGAMVAPAPVSGLLHAVLVVKSGIFLLFKVTMHIFGITFLKEELYKIFNIPWPIFISCITMIYASFIAIFTENIKKRLAYSTISQLSYMCTMIFYLSEEINMVIGIHFIAHSLAKLNLFFYAGYLYIYNIHSVKELKKQEINSIFMKISFLIAAISLMGLPPTFGFIAKFNMLLYGVNIMEDFIILGSILFSTIASVLYLIPLIHNMILIKTKKYITRYSRFKLFLIQPKQKILHHFIFVISTTIPSILLVLLFFLFEYDSNLFFKLLKFKYLYKS